MLFVAKRPFNPSAGDAWRKYIAWSGLSHLREVISLDTILCPTVPDELTAADWDHNVHADYQVFFFRSLEYLRQRVKEAGALSILAVLRNPTKGDVDAVALPGFDFAGFDLLDIHGDVSALTNCGGFDGVFSNSELSECGLLTEHARAQEVQAALRIQYPQQSDAECDVWALWVQRVAQGPRS